MAFVENPFININIPIPTIDSKMLPRVANFSRQCKLNMTTAIGTLVRDRGGYSIPGELMAMVRMGVLSRGDYPFGGIGEAGCTAMCTTDANHRPPVSYDNEMLALRYIGQILYEGYSRFPTTIEQDTASYTQARTWQDRVTSAFHIDVKTSLLGFYMETLQWQGNITKWS